VAVVVDTASVPEDQRAAYWARASDDLFFPLEVTQGPAFTARAHGHVLGPVLVRRVAAGASRAVRTPAAIARADPERIELTLIVAGSQVREQDGRRVELGPGDLTAVDTSRPFSVLSEEPFEMLAFSVPRRSLGRTVASTGTPLAGDGVGTVTAPFLRSVGDGLLEGRVSESDGSVGHAIVELVRALFADRGRGPALSRRSLALAQAQAAIEERLHDPDLSPTTIAAEQFISLRLLHLLFAEEGLTVGGWIRERRLEQARRDLQDAALGERSVSEIALAWGFRNPGHFARVFRARFGVSPSDVR
jgi:AraC-like DNA-binding protein